MKILQVSQYMFFGGGVSFHVMDLAKKISEHEDVEILTFDTEENSVTDAEDISRIKEKDPYYESLEKSVEISEVSVEPDLISNALLSKMIDADIVHLHMTLSFRGLSKITLLISQILDTEIFVTVHTSESSRKNLNNLHSNFYDLLGSHNVISVSRAVQKKLESKGIDSEVVQNGVNLNYFSDNHSKSEGLLFVGRNVERKGIKVFKESARKNREIKHKFVTNNLDSDIEELPNTTYKSNLTRSELRREYRESEALVLPSKWGEGMPLVIIESLACGTPVISSDAPGNRRTLNSEVGRNIENITSSKIMEAYSEMNLEEKSKKCRKHSKKFSLESKVEKILGKYREELK